VVVFLRETYLNGTLLLQPDSSPFTAPTLSLPLHCFSSKTQLVCDSISTIITMSNSEHNIITGHAGYVLEDVPHLSHYIPHLTVPSCSLNVYLFLLKKPGKTKDTTCVASCMSL